MYPSMAWKCVCTASAHGWRSGFLCHSSSSTPPTFNAFHPPTPPLSLCVSHPSYAPSLPPFSPVSGANTVPCRVGHVMKKWLVRALRRTSYFIISRAFLPFTVRWLSPPLFLPLSPLLFLSLFRLLPSFCSSHTQGGDLSSARGEKRKKVCCYFYGQGLPTARPSIDGAFFSLTTSWILTLCLQLAAQQLCKT